MVFAPQRRKDLERESGFSEVNNICHNISADSSFKEEENLEFIQRNNCHFRNHTTSYKQSTKQTKLQERQLKRNPDSSSKSFLLYVVYERKSTLAPLLDHFSTNIYRLNEPPDIQYMQYTVIHLKLHFQIEFFVGQTKVISIWLNCIINFNFCKAYFFFKPVFSIY